MGRGAAAGCGARWGAAAAGTAGLMPGRCLCAQKENSGPLSGRSSSRDRAGAVVPRLFIPTGSNRVPQHPHLPHLIPNPPGADAARGPRSAAVRVLGGRGRRGDGPFRRGAAPVGRILRRPGKRRRAGHGRARLRRVGRRAARRARGLAAAPRLARARRPARRTAARRPLRPARAAVRAAVDDAAARLPALGAPAAAAAPRAPVPGPLRPLRRPALVRAPGAPVLPALLLLPPLPARPAHPAPARPVPPAAAAAAAAAGLPPAPAQPARPVRVVSNAEPPRPQQAGQKVRVPKVRQGVRDAREHEPPLEGARRGPAEQALLPHPRVRQVVRARGQHEDAPQVPPAADQRRGRRRRRRGVGRGRPAPSLDRHLRSAGSSVRRSIRAGARSGIP